MKNESIFPGDTQSNLYFFGILGSFLAGYGLFRFATRNVFELSRFSLVYFFVEMAVLVFGLVLALCEIVHIRKAFPGIAILTFQAGCGLLAALIWSIEAVADLPYFSQLLRSGQLASWQYHCLRLLLVTNLTLTVAYTLSSSVLLCRANLQKNQE